MDGSRARLAAGVAAAVLAFAGVGCGSSNEDLVNSVYEEGQELSSEAVDAVDQAAPDADEAAKDAPKPGKEATK